MQFPLIFKVILTAENRKASYLNWCLNNPVVRWRYLDFQAAERTNVDCLQWGPWKFRDLWSVNVLLLKNYCTNQFEISCLTTHAVSQRGSFVHLWFKKRELARNRNYFWRNEGNVRFDPFDKQWWICTDQSGYVYLGFSMQFIRG